MKILLEIILFIGALIVGTGVIMLAIHKDEIWEEIYKRLK